MKKYCCNCENQGKGCFQTHIHFGGYPSGVPYEACVGKGICLFTPKPIKAHFIDIIRNGVTMMGFLVYADDPQEAMKILREELGDDDYYIRQVTEIQGNNKHVHRVMTGRKYVDAYNKREADIRKLHKWITFFGVIALIEAAIIVVGVCYAMSHQGIR